MKGAIPSDHRPHDRNSQRAAVSVSRDRNVSSGLDFSATMRTLCADVTARVEQLGHIDLSRMAIGFCQARRPVPHGMLAALVPLRFQEGSLTTVRRGRRYEIPRIHDATGRELLYLLRFYLPRFFRLPESEKLLTVVHELWHIGPKFDGDLRRFPGRCYAHSHSQKEFDRQVQVLVDAYLATNPDPRHRAFLTMNDTQLRAHYGRIYGLSVKVPRLRRIT